jgi:hypothetical protein
VPIPSSIRRSLGHAGALALLAALALAPAAFAQSGGIGLPGSNSATVKGADAKLRDGRAIPPESAPAKVKRAIRAANEIAKGHPYCYGGGHARWRSSCYDCSGSVSYALGKYGARILDSPLPSSSFTHWAKRGKGRWITVYAHSGHAFVVIAGLRFDTSQTPGQGPGWSESVRAGLANGPFEKRHRGRL